jgi:hypothetical protein
MHPLSTFLLQEMFRYPKQRCNASEREKGEREGERKEREREGERKERGRGEERRNINKKNLTIA